MSVSVIGGSSGGLQPYEQLFTSSGTWTKPSGVKTVEVTVVGGSAGIVASSPAATGAGGYWRGIVDVSAVTSVAVTVGAGGSSAATPSVGGTSSFGNFIAASGSTGKLVIYDQGHAYFPTTVGWYSNQTTVPLIATTGTFNGGDVRQGNNGYRTSDGTLWISAYSSSYAQYCLWSSTDNGASWGNYTQILGLGSSGNGVRVMSYNGKYLATEILGSTSSTKSSSYTSSTLPSWTQQGGAYTDVAVGPAGFVKVTSGSSTVQYSVDGITWSNSNALASYTGSSPGITANSAGYYVLQNSSNSIWYSTDAINWSVIPLFNGSTTVSNYGSYSRSALTASPVFAQISGTAVYALNGGTATYLNLPSSPSLHFGDDGVIYTSNGIYSYSTGATTAFPSSGVLYVNSYGTLCTPTGNNTTNIAVYKGFRGMSGGGSNGSISAGAGGPAVTNTTNAMNVAGAGIEGWACGASYQTGSLYSSAGTFGSGVSLTSTGTLSIPGNQGVVRVRWWA